MAIGSRRWARITTMIASGLMLAVVPASASALPTGGTPTPGSEGLGDPIFPTYGNGGYRVAHYDIDVAYDPSTRRLTGTTTIRAAATQTLSSFHLDFLLATEAVTVNGRPASFSQYTTDEPAGWWGGGELVVTPARPLNRGQAMTVVVSYADVPAEVAAGSNDYRAWRTTPSGALVMGMPASSAWWYPSNDHPGDKATFDIAITVPEGKTAISQGVLVGSRSHAGKTTWRWREDRPMVTYTSFAAIGDYRIETDRTDDGVPLLYAFAENPGDHGDKAEADIRQTGDVIDWHSTMWGPYPFDVTGGVLADVSAGMETQTKPVYGASWWRDWTKPYPGWDIVVHENAHQWFGNSLSMRTYADFWMSEGFATFSELLWAEEHGGLSVAEFVDATYDRYPADDPFWSVTIGSADSVAEWTGAMYIRGAMTLQALRTRLGEPAFFELMRTWVADHRYGKVTTDRFIEYVERFSGQDLDTFFDVWLYTPSRPDPTPANGFPAS